MSESILTTNELRRSFGAIEAVRGISFMMMRGEIFSLLGPNGAGKTTMISMLSCLLTPTAGDAFVSGHSVIKEPMAVKRLIGVVPQEIALYSTLTARQNLQFWGRMYGMGGRELKQRSDEVLEQVGLVDRADGRVDTFSGGMKRRLNIAAGLLHRPQILFMDEPTVGIDPQSRRNILDMVTELRQEGMTILYTTHYMEEAQELSDRVGIVDHGRLIALGTQKELTRLVGEQETLRLHLADGQSTDDVAAVFGQLPQVLVATALDSQLVLSVPEASEALAAVVSKANEIDLNIRAVEIEEPNLEAVFLHLTGRALRD